MSKQNKLSRTGSLSSDTSSGQRNSKGYQFYIDAKMNATVPTWFVECGREEAEKLLKAGHKGHSAILLRPSAKTGCMALTVQTVIAGNADFNHYSVIKTNQGYIIDIEKHHTPMRTLSEVVDQFIKMAGSPTRKYLLYGQGLTLKKSWSNDSSPPPSHNMSQQHKFPPPALPGAQSDMAPPVAPRPNRTFVGNRRGSVEPPHSGYLEPIDLSTGRLLDGYVDTSDGFANGRATANGDDSNGYLTICSEEQQTRKPPNTSSPEYLTMYAVTPAGNDDERLYGSSNNDAGQYLTVCADDAAEVSAALSTATITDKNNNTNKNGAPPAPPRPAHTF